MGFSKVFKWGLFLLITLLIIGEFEGWEEDNWDNEKELILFKKLEDCD